MAMRFAGSAHGGWEFYPPGASGKSARELAVKARVEAQALGEGEDPLTVRNGGADFFRHVLSGQYVRMGS